MKRITILFFLALMTVLFVTAGCSNNQRSANVPGSADDSLNRPDTELRGANIYLYNRDHMTTSILADRILKFESKDSTMAYKLDIDIFDSLGNVSTKVVGDSGVIRENSGLLNIFGNVVVTTDNKSKLETDYLWWDSKAEKIRTDAFVRITKETDVITGWGLETDSRMTRLKILDQVSGELTDPENLEPR